jgi:hypothetical protein
MVVRCTPAPSSGHAHTKIAQVIGINAHRAGF